LRCVYRSVDDRSRFQFASWSTGWLFGVSALVGVSCSKMDGCGFANRIIAVKKTSDSVSRLRQQTRARRARFAAAHAKGMKALHEQDLREAERGDS